MTGILTTAALTVTGAGLLVAVAVYATPRRLGRVLPVLLDFLTAAGLIRLAADVSWGSILAAAAVIAVRKIAALGVQAGQGIGKRV
ncbi:hypothetical protein QNO09_38730 [Streptomyces sp. 378]|uniref:hypothetical protein n=1 Tax=Streptomyces sp. 378 TaxID=3049412 RepID=UPI0024C3A734|nr:hypothetical protein [Streptomyces sp. 378]MDK1349082.1 hypothetical protein [Streptomyces sp. 378]